MVSCSELKINCHSRDLLVWQKLLFFLLVIENVEVTKSDVADIY